MPTNFRSGKRRQIFSVNQKPVTGPRQPTLVSGRRKKFNFFSKVHNTTTSRLFLEGLKKLGTKR